MMNRTRRVDEFDRALATGKTTDPAIAALVALAGAVAAVPQRSAPAFREGLRASLMSEATKIAAAGSAASMAAGAVPAATGLKALPQVLAKPAMQVLTGGLAATIAATGVGVGASRSLPGDPLYGLKKAVERLQDNFAGGTVAEAGSVVEHAQTRVDEIVALIDRDGLKADVDGTLRDLKADLDRATADLLAQARAGSQAAYDKLGATVDEFMAELNALRGTLPPDAQDEFDAVLATINSAAAQLHALPRPAGPKPSPTSVKTTPPPTSPTTNPSSPTGSPSTTLPTDVPTTPTLPTIDPTVVPTPTPTIPLPSVSLPPLFP